MESTENPGNTLSAVVELSKKLPDSRKFILHEDDAHKEICDGKARDTGQIIEILQLNTHKLINGKEHNRIMGISGLDDILSRNEKSNGKSSITHKVVKDAIKENKISEGLIEKIIKLYELEGTEKGREISEVLRNADKTPRPVEKEIVAKEKTSEKTDKNQVLKWTFDADKLPGENDDLDGIGKSSIIGIIRKAIEIERTGKKEPTNEEMAIIINSLKLKEVPEINKDTIEAMVGSKYFVPNLFTGLAEYLGLEDSKFGALMLKFDEQIIRNAAEKTGNGHKASLSNRVRFGVRKFTEDEMKDLEGKYNSPSFQEKFRRNRASVSKENANPTPDSAAKKILEILEGKNSQPDGMTRNR